MIMTAPAGYAMSPDIGFTAIDVLPRLLNPMTFSNVSYIDESVIILQKDLEVADPVDMFLLL